MKKIALASAVFVSTIFLAGCNDNQDASTNTNNNTNPPQNNQQGTEEPLTINQGDLVFFWGQGCPHCENVEKFLEQNKGLEEKIKLKKIRVYHTEKLRAVPDPNGQKLFLEKVEECKLETAGVPVLYKDGKCTQGDTPIIEELKKNL